MPNGFESALRSWVREEGVPLLLSDDGLTPVTRQGDLAIHLVAGRVQDIHSRQPAVVA